MCGITLDIRQKRIKLPFFTHSTNMLTAICIALILLTLVSFNIISEVRVDFDFYAKSFAVSFYLFGFKIIRIDILFHRSESEVFMIELWNKDKLIKSLGFREMNKSNAKDTIGSTLPNPFYNLDIIELELSAEYGGENAFNTVRTIMAAKWLISFAGLYITSMQRVKVQSYIKPNFDSRAIIMNLSGIFSITIADIIYGIIWGKRSKQQ